MFEGSCDLIPVQVVADYCKKLADEFIPELVETLASEMNPDTVCTVAGKFYKETHFLCKENVFIRALIRVNLKAYFKHLFSFLWYRTV